MDAKNKLANLFVDHEVAVMTPGGDSWLTRDQRAMVVAALREYVHGEWIACADRLPEIGRIVLAAALCVDRATLRIVGHRQERGWILATTEDVTVTHWMPIPEVPRISNGTSK